MPHVEHVAILCCGKSRGQFDRVRIRHNSDGGRICFVVPFADECGSSDLVLSSGNQEQSKAFSVYLA